MSATHVVTNQVPPRADFDAWSADALLVEAVGRADAAWVAEQARAVGRFVGSAECAELARDAHRHPPELQTHDRGGQRIDAVACHPAWHALMGRAFAAGCHALAWVDQRPGRWAARAALNYLWNQGEQGTSCPVTMTFAGVHVIRGEPALAALWLPKLTAFDYDPRPLPVAAKRAALVGMAMTEKQGGSDLRANTTEARPDGDGFRLTGHKWFCSVPMSDAFLTLARSAAGLTCFLVPRTLPDGTRNRFLIQRLKDKVGNRSNASAEIEYDGTWAEQVGEAGRGIATIIGMAHLTRFDIVIACAGMMRAMLGEALHHTRHREAFGRRLAEHAAMRAVLADLAIESEAALHLAFRLARAFDRAADDAHERGLTRIVTPIAKYWLCKRMPAVALEAMECFGGNGYVEEAPIARLYREAPLNGIWEGSGNVICLDVLRTAAREPAAVAALLAEIAACHDARVATHVAATRALLADPAHAEANARLAVERLAIALQASLLLRIAPAGVAEAFIATRVENRGGRVLGTLPAATDCGAIVARAALRD